MLAGNTKDVGDETEAKVVYELVAAGLSVSVPFGDNDKYDVIVDDGEELYRVQCKTAWQNKPETIRFNTHSQTTKEGQYHEETYEGAVDVFLVHYPGKDQLYWVEIGDPTQQKVGLRFSADIEHPSISWASGFEFEPTELSR